MAGFYWLVKTNFMWKRDLSYHTANSFIKIKLHIRKPTTSLFGAAIVIKEFVKQNKFAEKKVFVLLSIIPFSAQIIIEQTSLLEL